MAAVISAAVKFPSCGPANRKADAPVVIFITIAPAESPWPPKFVQPAGKVMEKFAFDTRTWEKAGATAAQTARPQAADNIRMVEWLRNIQASCGFHLV